ncbi:MAG: hypothetical protein Q7S40_01995 [Opitutaceae bacterium]|nr:hypothetical protein [Opitutaceae bacterium]
MAEKSSRPSRKSGSNTSDPFRQYEESFVATPDPWTEISKLEHGSDRSFASTVRSIVMNAEPAQRPGFETKLLAALERPGCTDVGARFIGEMLALIGGAKTVAALAPRLHQPKTADNARYALEPIAEPAVDEAFRAALGQLGGPPKIGLIGSIALRGDRAAVPALAAIQKNPAEPAAAREAAGRALERLNARS